MFNMFKIFRCQLIYLFFFVLFFLTPKLAGSYETQLSRPNIIVIMTDDQDDMGTLDVMTNVKSRLLKQGVRFINSFAENPICCPSRATFLTGQTSHNNGVWGNIPGHPKAGGVGALADGSTLSVWLQQAGYYTGLIGKYLNGYGTATPTTYIPPGWNTWQGLVDPFTYRYYNYIVNENGTLHTYGNTAADYQTDVLSGKAVDFINARANSSQPFFLWLTPLAPHVGRPGVGVPEPAPRHKGLFSDIPLPQPPSFNESDISDKPQFMKDNIPLMDGPTVAEALDSYRKRRESLLAVDEMVAKVIDTLRQTNKLNNTYIIFTSDNGWFNGEHRFPEGKTLIYEESIRVPLIIRGPGVPVGQTRDQLVNNTDLAPTILKLAQATAGLIQDGRSIIPIIKNPGLPGRTAMLFEGIDAIYKSPLFGYYTAIRTKRFVYVEHTPHDGSEVVTDKEFYDLQNDPYQLQSRPNDTNYAEIISYLKRKLTMLQTCEGSTCWMNSIVPAELDLSMPFDVEESDLTPSEKKALGYWYNWKRGVKL